MDRWARAFELHKFPEIGDMKPSEMMRQMKALLPPDSTAGTYFMAAFQLRLPADMIDHIISQDFKDSNKMAEYADKLYARRRGNTVAAVNAYHDSAISAVSCGRRRESSLHDRRRIHIAIGRIHIGHQTHTRPGEHGSGRLEPPAFCSCAAAAAEPTAPSCPHR